METALLGPEVAVVVVAAVAGALAALGVEALAWRRHQAALQAARPPDPAAPASADDPAWLAVEPVLLAFGTALAARDVRTCLGLMGVAGYAAPPPSAANGGARDATGPPD